MVSEITRWWWVRHAPVAQQGRRLYGQQDVPCAAIDTAALGPLAAALPENAAWVTSHLSRTRETAAALITAQGSAAQPGTEDDLAEQDFGQWQGLTWDEIQQRHAAASEAFWRDPARIAPPGGESFADVMARAKAVIERLTAVHADGDIVAIAHGGTIRAAVALALGLDPEHGMAVTIDNLSLSRLDHVPGGLLRGRGGAWRVVGVNWALAGVSSP